MNTDKLVELFMGQNEKQSLLEKLKVLPKCIEEIILKKVVEINYSRVLIEIRKVFIINKRKYIKPTVDHIINDIINEHNYWEEMENDRQMELFQEREHKKHINRKSDYEYNQIVIEYDIIDDTIYDTDTEEKYEGEDIIRITTYMNNHCNIHNDNNNCVIGDSDSDSDSEESEESESDE